MRAEELQIGDWVLCDINAQSEYEFDTVDYQPYQIQDGEDIDYACEKNMRGDNDVYLPIPLTVEILENNGFVDNNVFAETLGLEIFGSEKYNCGLYWYDDEYWCFEIYERWVETDEYGAPIDFKCTNTTFIERIKFVHEFQHALRLCGIDKKIKL